MGTGHVMRCLALAQAWQDAGGRALFAAVGMPGGLEARLAADRVDVVRLGVEPGSPDDAGRTAAMARQAGACWVALDGYHFSGDYQGRLKDAGLRLLAIDDYGHAGRYRADLVLNQNLHAREGLYREREPSTQLLLGTRYALLRREFWGRRGWKRGVPDVARRVLVTLGGSDPDNVTLKVIEALGRVRVPGLEALVVVGGGNPHRAELEAAAQNSGAAVRLRADVTDMSEPMAWADVAVSAGGSTNWELAVAGLPSCCTILADNQVQVARSLEERGVAVNLGWAPTWAPGRLALVLEDLIHNPRRRGEMSRQAQRLVDGEGASRVVEAMGRVKGTADHDANQSCR
jgi:UDP-2,4-diacetamido-2,4,6-trideoxy-beta-L-altropyranose hydrolase